MPIEVTATDADINVSASGTKIDATVSGGQGPAGPTGAAGPTGPAGAQGEPGEPSVVSADAPITYDAENQSVGWGAFSNGTSLAIGTFDNMTGGANGISLNCAVGYELNWQGGRLRNVQAGGDGTPQPINSDSPIIWPDDEDLSVEISSAGITFAADSARIVCSANGMEFLNDPNAAAWVFSAPTGEGNLAQFYWADNGGSRIQIFAPLKFSDDSEQTTAFTGTIAAEDVTGLAAVATSGDYGDLSNTPAAYTLPTATDTILGGVKVGSGVTITDGVISVSTAYAATSHTHAWSDITSGVPTTLSGYGITDAVASNDSRLTDARAPTSHAHGNITNAGAIGTTSGLVVTTGASGVLGALAQGTAGQVLKVNGTATGVEWGAAAADVSIDTSAADVLSASSGSITADDPGADRLVFWDDSAGKLTHLTAGSGLSISGTTITAAGAVTVTSPSQITSSQNDYAGATADINRITSDAARDITGIAAGTDGQAILLVNVGSFTITLKHQSASSTAANRIIVPWAGDYAIPASGSATLVYDNTTARWRVL